MAGKIEKAIIWGDSIGKGVIYDETRRRYTISPLNAVATVAQKLGIEMINRCRMGMTAEQGLAMMEKDCAKGLTADVAIIEFGGNDCDFDWPAISASPELAHQPKTPFPRFAETLKAMVEKVRSLGMTPVLVNLPPINAERYFSFISAGVSNADNVMKWLGTTHQIYRYQERYSLGVDRVAAECHCQLFNIRSAFLDLWRVDPLLCADGIHPNTAGQQFIAESALRALDV